MYRTINSLLNKPSLILPDSDSKHDLANKFLTFFIEKVENIRNDVNSKDASASAGLSEYDTVSQCSLSDFQPLESEDITAIIRQFQSKSCSGDKRQFSPKILFLLKNTWYDHMTQAYALAGIRLQKFPDQISFLGYLGSQGSKGHFHKRML